MTNLDNDYDNDGNNIVPCPICDSAYCPSKEKGKCPEEDEFVRAVNLQQLQESELAVFWEEISSNLPKSIERSELGDEKIFLAFKIAYPKIREHLFKAGQQDMLERVKYTVPEDIWITNGQIAPSHDSANWRNGFNKCREATLKALDNLN